MLNGSLDVLQFEGETKHLDRIHYRSASHQVLNSLRHPFSVVSRYGASKFVRQELLPLSFTPRKMQWWPNYNLHLLGGGMTYVKMSEWYDYYGFDHPEIYSLATMAAYHYLNEVVEMRNRRPNVDPIADVFFFDIGGILLFSSDDVKQFFSQTVVMSDWSGQPMFSLRDGTLSNNGQYFSFKWKLPASKHWHLFYLAGVEGLAGTSYRNEDGSSISAAFGFIGERRNTIDPLTNEQAIVLSWRAGFFYDQDNSLLTSVYVSGLRSELFKINVYPGLFTFNEFSFGGVLSVSRRGETTFGITMNWFPGISVSVR
jgi:hypothetical protein